MFKSTTATTNSGIEINSVLKNTYMLLGITLMFSALMAGGSMMLGVPPISFFIVLPVYFVLLFIVHKTADSGWGLVSTFAFTGFMGFTLGPMLSAVMTLPGGGVAIVQALASTALIFLTLSGYVLMKKDSLDLSSWGPFIGITMLVSFVMSLINFFFLQSTMLGIVISVVFTIISGALIMFETNQIINGGQRNYILATISLYVAIYNIFINLLSLFISFGDD